MPLQSARHIMMMEPVAFHSNPETRETNTYQADDPADPASINAVAVAEFRGLRDRLVEAGLIVTTVQGHPGSPDDIFCNNWVSTHTDDAGRGSMVLYPMLAENRRIERRPELLKMLGGRYQTALDLSAEERAGKYLESTGSLALDRVNKRAYVALSPRTSRALADRWGQAMGFEMNYFDTRNHVGKPVYHSDVLMFVGTTMMGVCVECILPNDRDRILSQIKRTHAVMEISMDQLRSFCGNALEVRGTGDMIGKHFDGGIISAPIPTIEKYGGGSCRCMLLEMH
jgi:hypothetical protein